MRDVTHPNLPSLREGVINPPCEGGLKVGANFNYQVSPMGCHPSQPSLKREGVIFPPCEGGLKVGADFNYQVSPMGCHPSLYLSQNVTFSHLLFGRVLKREGVNFPPCEGGLKVGANFNY